MAQTPIPNYAKLWKGLSTSEPETMNLFNFEEEFQEKKHGPGNSRHKSSKVEDKLSPLHCLALMGYNDVIADMIRNRKIKDINETSYTKKWTPLMFAIQGSHVDVVRQLLDNGANINHLAKDKTTPLHLAVTLGCLVTMETLLRFGAKVNIADSRGDTPLHLCMWHIGSGASSIGPLERLQMATLLIQAGAAVHLKNKIGDTALHVCLRYGHEVQLAEVLLKAPQSEQCLRMSNDTGHIPLQMTSDLVTMEMLLMRGSQVNYQGSDGRSILHMRANHPELVTLLIDHKADVNLKERNGQTPLHIVLANHSAPYQSMCHLLMSMSDINVQDINGNTPLHLACFRPQQSSDQNSPIIDLLLNKGAKVDIQNLKGETPLYICLKCGHQRHASQLLKAGASPDIKDKEGKSSRSFDPRWISRTLSGRPGRIEGKDGDILIGKTKELDLGKNIFEPRQEIHISTHRRTEGIEERTHGVPNVVGKDKKTRLQQKGQDKFGQLTHPRVTSLKYEGSVGKVQIEKCLDDGWSPRKPDMAKPTCGIRPMKLRNDRLPLNDCPGMKFSSKREHEEYLQNSLRWKKLSSEEQLREFKSNFRNLCQEVSSFKDILEQAMEMEPIQKPTGFFPKLKNDISKISLTKTDPKTASNQNIKRKGGIKFVV